MKKSKFDRFWVGFIPGIIVPVLAFIIYWLVMSDLSLGEYTYRFYKYNKLPSLISLSVLPNLLVFFVFIWTSNYRASRGVISATFLIALIMLILKFF